MIVLETLAIADVQPGMRLAEAVVDETGRLLVPDGCELTESLLLSLARRNIAELKISRDVEESPAVREAHRARIAGELDVLFRQAGDGEETRALYRAVLAFRLEHPA